MRSIHDYLCTPGYCERVQVHYFFLYKGLMRFNLNEISHFFLPPSRYTQSVYLSGHPNTTTKFKHVALKISGEGLDVSLLSLYKKYKSTNKNSQFQNYLSPPQKILFGEEYFFSSQNFPDFFRLNLLNNYPIQFATYNCQNYHNGLQIFL